MLLLTHNPLVQPPSSLQALIGPNLRNLPMIRTKLQADHEEIVFNFLSYKHDNTDERITPGLYTLLYFEKYKDPGFALFQETEIVKAGRECTDADDLYALADKSFRKCLPDPENWEWYQVTRAFYAIHLINEVAFYLFSPSDIEKFQSTLSKRMGAELATLKGFTHTTWLSMPRPAISSDCFPPFFLPPCPTSLLPPFLIGILAGYILQKLF